MRMVGKRRTLNRSGRAGTRRPSDGQTADRGPAVDRVVRAAQPVREPLVAEPAPALFPAPAWFSRLVYVTGSTVSLGVLMWWLRSLPATLLFDWPGWWTPLRWLGLAAALLMFCLGIRGYDGRFFLGLSQIRQYRRGVRGRRARLREPKGSWVMFVIPGTPAPSCSWSSTSPGPT